MSPLFHFVDWGSIIRILSIGSYCANLRIVRECLVSFLPLCHSFDLFFSYLIIFLSSGGTRSSISLLGDRSIEEEVDLREVGKEIVRTKLFYGAGCKKFTEMIRSVN